MEFTSPLLRGRLLRRYKRFFADIELDDKRLITAHCPNTGSMKTCADEGAVVWVQGHSDPKRRLAYTWEFTASAGALIGINTQRTNALVAEALGRGLLPELAGYTSIQREVRLGADSRLDFLLSGDAGGKPCWVEVKNATYRYGEVITFPDAVTSRGAKHLDALAAAVAGGDRGVLLYVVNRPDGIGFQAIRALDPRYFYAMEQAQAAGVEVLAYRPAVAIGPLGASSELRERVQVMTSKG